MITLLGLKFGGEGATGGTSSVSRDSFKTSPFCGNAPVFWPFDFPLDILFTLLCLNFLFVGLLRAAYFLNKFFLIDLERKTLHFFKCSRSFRFLSTKSIVSVSLFDIVWIFSCVRFSRFVVTAGPSEGGLGKLRFRPDCLPTFLIAKIPPQSSRKTSARRSHELQSELTKTK